MGQRGRDRELLSLIRLHYDIVIRFLHGIDIESFLPGIPVFFITNQPLFVVVRSFPDAACSPPQAVTSIDTTRIQAQVPRNSPLFFINSSTLILMFTYIFRYRVTISYSPSPLNGFSSFGIASFVKPLLYC